MAAQPRIQIATPDAQVATGRCPGRQMTVANHALDGGHRDAQAACRLAGGHQVVCHGEMVADRGGRWMDNLDLRFEREPSGLVSYYNRPMATLRNQTIAQVLEACAETPDTNITTSFAFEVPTFKARGAYRRLKIACFNAHVGHSGYRTFGLRKTKISVRLDGQGQDVASVIRGLGIV